MQQSNQFVVYYNTYKIKIKTVIQQKLLIVMTGQKPF